MWPPRSPGWRWARTTMAIAFQRISERMRHSIWASPGDLAFWPGGLVLMYSGVGANGRCAPARRVSSTMPLSSWCARGAVVVDDRLERFDPLLRLGRVGIVVEDFVEPVHRGALRRGPLAAQWSWNQTFHSIRGALARAGIQRSACDRKSVCAGKRVAVRVDLGCPRVLKKKNKI